MHFIDIKNINTGKTTYIRCDLIQQLATYEQSAGIVNKSNELKISYYLDFVCDNYDASCFTEVFESKELREERIKSVLSVLSTLPVVK